MNDETVDVAERRAKREGRTGAMTFAESLGLSGETTEVPCRVCKRPTPVSVDILGFARQFNRELRRRGEPLVKKGELASCPECDRKTRLGREDVANREHRQVVESVRAIKAGPGPDDLKHQRAIQTLCPGKHPMTGKTKLETLMEQRRKRGGGKGVDDV